MFQQGEGVLTQREARWKKPLFGSGGYVLQYDYTDHTPTKPSLWHKGRSDIVHSDGVRPTAYHAFEVKAANDYLEHKTDTYSGRYRDVEEIYGTPNLSTSLCYPYLTTDGRPALPGSLRLRADARHLSDIKGKASGLATAAAETVEGLPQMAKDVARIAKGLAAVKKGNWAAVAAEFGSPKGASDSFLSYQLGWGPLFSDLFSLQEDIKEAWTGKTVTVKTVTIDRLSAYVPGASLYRTGWCTGGYLHQSTFGIDGDGALSLTRLGLTNPLKVAWDLVGLSFVFDWFLDIGSFLEGLDATRNLTFKHGFNTAFVRTESVEIVDTGWIHIFGEPARAKVEAKGMERSPVSTFVSPTLSLGSGLNSPRAAILTALALVRS